MQFGVAGSQNQKSEDNLIVPAFELEALISGKLFVSVRNSPTRQIIRGQFNADSITSQYAYKVLSHLTRNLCKNHVLGSLELHFEEGVGQFVYDDTLSRNKIFFGQALVSCCWNTFTQGRRARRPRSQGKTQRVAISNVLDEMSGGQRCCRVVRTQTFC